MSRPDTGAVTLAALGDTGVDVRLVAELADVDTIDDIDVVRRACLPGSRFRQRHLGRRSMTCLAICTTGRWTVSDVGSATKTAACTACRCTAGWGDGADDHVRPGDGRVVRRTHHRPRLWSGTTGRQPGAAWGARARRRPVGHRGGPGPPQRGARAAPRRVRAAARHWAGGRRCCSPTGTSGSAAIRGGCCSGPVSCCARRPVHRRIRLRGRGCPAPLGAARVGADHRAVVPVGVGRHRLRRRARGGGRAGADRDPPGRPARFGEADPGVAVHCGPAEPHRQRALMANIAAVSSSHLPRNTS